MENEYAMALPQRPRSRRRARRRRWPLMPAMLLAAVLLVPAIWRGLGGGKTSTTSATSATSTTSTTSTISATSAQRLPVEIIYQNPELPNGCEITSLAMLLTSVGCPADKLELYRDYLPKADFSYVGAQRYGPNPEKWYVGDAADLTGGWYCFENPIIQAADGWLKDHKSPFRARSLTGLSRSELDRYAQNKVPLIVWVTLSYASPQYSEEFSWTLEDGTQYHPYCNLHCVVLAGAEDGHYLIADPISGPTLVDKGAFWDSFSAMESRAIVVEQI